MRYSPPRSSGGDGGRQHDGSWEKLSSSWDKTPGDSRRSRDFGSRDGPEKRRRFEERNSLVELDFDARRAKVGSLEQNPHIAQWKGVPTVLREEEIVRVLAPDAPRMAYRRRRGEVKSVVHWGQRKLMLSEIEFLNMFAEPGITFVYAVCNATKHV
jgi:hypothetical protein